MEPEQRIHEGLRDKASSGLDSLAAAASRRSDNNGTEEDLDSKEERSQKHEPTKSQKGKVRKAYTITKQRERWTDGEHDRFLQALKRYGRAWRKIEEHIGTKTAVQIRSHAQKFFSKLQREQSMSGIGEESSKAGISIPPPRPKRKPSHPYPRKYSGSSENEQSGDADGERDGNPSLPTQPSSTPSYANPSSQQPLSGSNANADMSLSQILESAAAAAAFAWSQVVSHAAPKVQQQLQAQVAAHQTAQGMQPFFGVQHLQQNAAMLQASSQKLQPTHSLQEAMVKTLASSSQHLSNQFLRTSQGRSMYSSASPANLRQIQSERNSPDTCGNASGTGTEKDCASSREHNKDFTAPAVRPRTVSPIQAMPQYWTGLAAAPSELCLGRAALNLKARSQVQHPIALSAQQGTLPNSLPHYRAFSAGAEVGIGQPAHRQEKPKVLKASTPDLGKSNYSSQGHSDISQLAQYYQQIAAQERQAADHAENGSSAGAEGASGSGGGSTSGKKRSDKGSANNNTSGSDEDGPGQNGNGSDGRTNNADLCAKGSDDGSNSPADLTYISPKKEDEEKHASQPSSHTTPLLFSMGTDPTGLAGTIATHWQPPQHSTMATQTSDPQIPQALTQQQLAAYQQQVLQAWAASTQQTLPNFQLLQSMLSSMQPSRPSSHTNEALNLLTPLPGIKPLQLEQRSSDVPSMDTFNASNRSFSIPTFKSDGRRQNSLATSNKKEGSVATSRKREEEHSGFKPYSKKHGMPISSLPPSKRFAAATNVDRPVAVKAQPVPRLYTPFGSFNVQGQIRSPAS